MNIITYIINIGFGLALLLNGLIVIPQIIQIIKTKNARNLSFITFFGFWLLQITMLIHGYSHNDLKLALGMLLSIITTGVLIILILIYGNDIFRKNIA